MKTINVQLQSCSYPIWVGKGLQKQIPKLLHPMNQGQVWAIFSQDEIYSRYGKTLNNSLQKNGYNTIYISLPEGESAKSINVLEKLYSKLLDAACDRSSIFLALGGGVVGDMTGFAAATYMRGVDYIQIPTTLLSMIDSSIGGKTAINLSEGKNLVGAFWQPRSVIIDPDFLTTLPRREFTSAMGEIIKYGAILDVNLFNTVSENLNDLMDLKDITLLLEIILQCIKIKSKIVSSDEKEKGARRILNFGHTFGHALETYFDFDTIRHGEAIAYGMLLAGNLSVHYSTLSNQDYELLRHTIKKLPLPTLKAIDSQKILNIMKNDKKVNQGKLSFILLDQIGHAVVHENISERNIINALETL